MYEMTFVLQQIPYPNCNNYCVHFFKISVTSKDDCTEDIEFDRLPYLKSTEV